MFIAILFLVEKNIGDFFIKPPIFPSLQYSKLYYKQYSLLQISVPLFTEICSCRLYINPQSTEKLLYKQWRPKGVFQFEIIINAFLNALSASFEYLSSWVYDHYKYLNP